MSHTMTQGATRGGDSVLVREVRVEYATADGPVCALDLARFRVAAGHAVAVMGPSGSGKSTLLSLLAGLAVPTTGTVSVGEIALSSMPGSARPSFRREHLGMVYQADNLLPHLTVEENVALSLAVAQPGVDAAARCGEVLDALGIGELTRRFPDQLSGGQRQRVGVARAVASRPSLILADEPTGSLDTETAHSVITTLLDASRSVCATLVLVTHDPVVAQAIGATYHLHPGSDDGQDR